MADHNYNGYYLVDPLIPLGNISEVSPLTEIFPCEEDIFKALRLTPLSEVKVVILGQDPYHGEDQANGLAFSVNRGLRIPPSLCNIYREIGIDPGHGDLTSWANQGVLLLNSILTVEKGKPGSHANIGWEEITDRIITHISEQKEGVVFMLWGGYARKKKSLIKNLGLHRILEAPHPSPLSAYRGFFGCNHFNLANQFLVECGKDPIRWGYL